MTKPRSTFLFCFLFLLALSFGTTNPVCAQGKPAATTESKSGQNDPIVKSEVTRVTLPVTVTDDDDRFIRALTKEDFEVFEDKKKQDIEDFKASSDLPLYIAVLMDTSASVKGKIKFEKEATISFLQTILRRRKDQALFVTFDSTVEMRQDFTDNTELLAKAINTVKASGTTSLYDAVYRICEEKMYNVPTPRKVIIILSDGEDTSSQHTLQQTIDLAQKSEVVIYAISTKNAGFFGVAGGQVLNDDDKELRRLCQETGGDITFPNKPLDLERAFQRYDAQARQYYLLSYEPQDLNRPGFRKIEVKLTNRKGLKVRTRAGYTVEKKN
ncbi:MAG: VWA domain-containing protein [Blastocatellia bacterium]|nr:VWA domain-containing protein [Blastocatellia bacterium]